MYINAIIKVLKYFNDGYNWIVDIDLKSFFDIVNQDKLIVITKRTIKDGNLISPLLFNIMLNELDKELEKRDLNFVRYAGDFLIIVKSEKVANRIIESITTFIIRKLGLKVNVEKSKV